MGRPTKRQQFVTYLFKEIETEEGWRDYRDAIYKELLINQKCGWPRLLYNHLINLAELYWDCMTSECPDLTKEELIADMGDVLDDKLTRKLIEKYTGITAL